MLHSIDGNGRLVHVSRMWLVILGYEQTEVIGRQWADFLDVESREYALKEVIPLLFAAGSVSNIEYRVRRRDGVLLNVVASSVVEHDMSNGQPLSLTVMHDVTEEKRLQAAIADQTELWRVTLQSIGDGVIRTDASGRVNYLNPMAERLTGWSNHAAYGRPVDVVFRTVHEANRRRVRIPVGQCLSEGRTVSQPGRAILIGRDCNEHCVKSSISPIKDGFGQAMGVVLVFYDISEQQNLREQIRYRATHDRLTKLFNRDEFERRLKLKLKESHACDSQHALLYLDLDQFKVVNDAAGHAIGDQLLCQVASILRRGVRRTDTVARVGGDEFAIIIDQCSMEGAERVARKLLSRIDAFRFPVESQSFRVSASVGCVPIDSRWSDAENVLKAADGACFAAKEAGRNRFHTYLTNDRVIGSHRQAMQWVRRIEHALDGDRFVVHWQGITPLTEGKEGRHCEILVRMIDETGNLILPGAFLPSAERFGIASRIDRWVIRTVLKWMATHRFDLAHVATISINLSGHSVGDKEFHKEVADLLLETGVDSSKLCFEITETAAIKNIYDAMAFFSIMKSHGVRFSLDDFGSGMSSFAYLKELPVDYLKIDGEFIRNLNTDRIDQATVRCIREVALITGKKTVAEFVETEEVENLLREIGIDYSQGYLRHRPSPMDELLTPPEG